MPPLIGWDLKMLIYTHSIFLEIQIQKELPYCCDLGMTLETIQRTTRTAEALQLHTITRSMQTKQSATAPLFVPTLKDRNSLVSGSVWRRFICIRQQDHLIRLRCHIIEHAKRHIRILTEMQSDSEWQGKAAKVGGGESTRHVNI